MYKSRRSFLKTLPSAGILTLSGVNLLGCREKPDRSLDPQPLDIYHKYGFLDAQDYQAKGAPFVTGTLDDFVMVPNLHAHTFSRRNALDLYIKTPNRPPHYLMCWHSGMVKAALYERVPFPNVDVFLHIDAHIDTLDMGASDGESAQWLDCPPSTQSAVSINEYAESDVTETGWIRTFAWKYPLTDIVFITHGPSLVASKSGSRQALLVLEKNGLSGIKQYGISFSDSWKNTPGIAVIREITWHVMTFPGDYQALETIIGKKKWAFSICNDVYIPDWYEGQGKPISLQQHVDPLIDVLKKLPAPEYGCTNNSTDYTRHPDSFETSLHFHKHFFATA